MIYSQFWPVSTAAFTAVEIPYTEALWQDPDTQVTMLSQETGLPTPQWQLYPKEIFAIMQWTLYIPILFFRNCFAIPFCTYYKRMARDIQGWAGISDSAVIDIGITIFLPSLATMADPISVERFFMVETSIISVKKSLLCMAIYNTKLP